MKINYYVVLFIAITFFCCDNSTKKDQSQYEPYSDSKIDSIIQSLDTYFGTENIWSYKASVYSDILMHNPGECELYYERAIAYFLAEDYPAAILDYTHKLNNCTSEDEMPALLDGRGSAYLFNNDLDEAYSDFKNAIESANNIGYMFSNAYLNRGIVNYRIHNYSESISDMTMVIEDVLSNSIKADAYYFRALAKFDAKMNGCRDLEKAISGGISNSKTESLMKNECNY